MRRKESVKTIPVDDLLLNKIQVAIKAALAYESKMNGKRKLGITGEVGEILACHQLNLRLVLDSQSEGYDAIDQKRKLVQIKTRRSETEGMPRDLGRVSRFSTHKYDYALLVLLDHQYNLCEIWKANSTKLNPIIEIQKRRNPPLIKFKRAGKRIYSNECIYKKNNQTEKSSLADRMPLGKVMA